MAVFRASLDIRAPADQVFAVWSNVVDWPSWTASITSVESRGAGCLSVGARYRVRQPRLPAAEWTVTEIVPDHGFTWSTGALGVSTLGVHVVDPTPGGCRAVAELEHRGPLAPVVAALTRRLTAHYLEMELAGLRDRCEGPYPAEV